MQLHLPSQLGPEMAHVVKNSLKERQGPVYRTQSTKGLLITWHSQKRYLNTKPVITVTSNAHWYVLFHTPPDCLFEDVIRLTSKTPSKLCTTGPLCGESTSQRWLPVYFCILVLWGVICINSVSCRNTQWREGEVWWHCKCPLLGPLLLT